MKIISYERRERYGIIAGVPRICIFPTAVNIGGPFSFQQRFIAGLKKRGMEVCRDLKDLPYDAVLVTGGTRHVADLQHARSRGIRIVQRLDGINWLHRRRRTGWRHFLRAEYGNFIQSYIRRRLSSHIVYQSEFARSWWEARYGSTGVPCRVIYNGVDLKVYSPQGSRDLPAGRKRLLVVEGSMGGGYEQGLEQSIRLAEELAHEHPVELMIVGCVASPIQKDIQANCRIPIQWAGLVKAEQIPRLERSAHLLYSADIHPACPNAVIESLACGLPVVAFNTGSLPELVSPEAGRVVPYGGDPWKLESPDIAALAAAASEILSRLPRFRQGARKRAEARFDLEKMVEDYLQILLGSG